MKILGYIPARSGSKGVPDKNVKLLKGIPLLEYSVYSAVMAKEAGLLDRIVVSTDSKDYLALVDSYDIEPNYIRPAELAADTSPTIDGILHLLEWYKSTQDKTFDAVMILQPTAPFKTPSHIKQAIQLLENKVDATCIASVAMLADHHPMRIKKLEADGKLIDCCDHFQEAEPSRRQDFQPPMYIRNGAIYLTPVDILQKQHMIRGACVYGMPMPEANSSNIDEHLDFLIAEASLNYDDYQNDLAFFNGLIKQ